MPVQEGALFGMGNPLLDISATVPKELVEKYGAEFGGAILAEEKHLPLYDELVNNYNPEFIAGGATQNVLRVFHWLNQEAHATATFVGCVGKDKYGKLMEEKVTKDGLKVEYQTDESTQTGTCAVLVSGGERSLVANLGAANNYKHEHFKSEPVQKAMKDAQFYYFSGFFLTVSPESLKETGEHAVKENKTFCMNLSALFILNVFKQRLLDALPYTDFLFGNEDESREFSKIMGWDTDDVATIAAKASQLEKKNDKKKRYAIFTQGPDAVCVGYDGKSHTIPVKKIPKEKLIDTNGAGDAFCGGFLSYLAQGKEIDECVKAGVYTSSTIIQHGGCTYPDKPLPRDQWGI